MRQSFFGGDPGKAHFHAGVRYRLPDEVMGQPNYGKDRARRQADRQILKAAGFPDRYFEYRVKGVDPVDPAAKADAKRQCEEFAAEWTAKTGVLLEVAEGCFL